MKEIVVATAKKKTAKKRGAKKARKSPSARTAKAEASKKRAKTGNPPVKKAKKTEKKPARKNAKKAEKKTAAKKAPKKPSRTQTKKSSKGRPNKPIATANQTSVAEKTLSAGTSAKVGTPKEKAARIANPSTPTERKSFYITTAIAYPNGVPHIGHAYEAIATDALARFQRLDGKDVFFLTGTDEHGLKMIQTAEGEGLAVAELADRNAGRFRDMDERLNVSFDRFIRTTEPAHHRSVQVVWNRMQQNGDIYIDTYSGWYSVRDEAYYAEEETVLGEDNVRRGPQGSPVEWVEEKSYFFRLSTYQDRLLALYESQPDFIGPDSRRNEVISFVKGGLKDLSISRTTFDWGVKVPTDPEHVMYVWVDALTNYITGVGFPDETSENWRYWPADVHIIGKDIIRFHAVYWPAFLMSAGVPVQKRVYAHGF